MVSHQCTLSKQSLFNPKGRKLRLRLVDLYWLSFFTWHLYLISLNLSSSFLNWWSTFYARCPAHCRCLWDVPKLLHHHHCCDLPRFRLSSCSSSLLIPSLLNCRKKLVHSKVGKSNSRDNDCWFPQIIIYLLSLPVSWPFSTVCSYRTLSSVCFPVSSLFFVNVNMV